MEETTDIAGDTERRKNLGPDPPEPPDREFSGDPSSSQSEHRDVSTGRFLAAVAAAVRAALAAFEFLGRVAAAGAAAG